MRRVPIHFFLLAIFLLPVGAAKSAPRLDVKNDQVVFSFPETATFSAILSSIQEITSVTLEYGNEQQTCGEVIAKAFPAFTPANTVSAEWTWDMRQSGSLPPGASIWWRWRYTDASGAEFVSEKRTASWLDDIHAWRTVASDDLRLHYYGKDAAFAQAMLEAGLDGLRRNREQAGLVADGAIDIYIYPDYTDMQDAVLYEPSWTGGQAYSDFNIVIMGLSDFDDEWNRKTIVHELTHVLVGAFTFSCIGTLPGWIEEGLAMFSEGQLDSNMQIMLDNSIRNNSLISLRSLNGGFSELPEKANLSYAQSYSVIKFLIDTHGQEQMTDLLIALRDAKPIDEALIEVYGFDTDGLEDLWRGSIGATPRPVSAQVTLQPTPTLVPTFVPISGVPLAVTPTPFQIPDPSSEQGRRGPPLSLTISLVCFCGVLLLIVGVFVLGVMARRGNHNPEGDHV
jgi:hypothetical protein